MGFSDELVTVKGSVSADAIVREHEKVREGDEPKSGNLLDLKALALPVLSVQMEIKSARGFLFFFLWCREAGIACFLFSFREFSGKIMRRTR